MNFKENLSNYKIKTIYGDENFKGIRKSFKAALKFYFNNKTYIIVSKNHKFIQNDKIIIAKNLKINDFLFDKSGNKLFITNIEVLTKQWLFDIVGTNSHTYLTNNINSHNCDFLGSTFTIIDSNTLKTLFQQEIINPISNEIGGKLKYYELPIQNFKYIIGADPSKGTGKHDACIQVLKINQLSPILNTTQVAVFKDNLTDTLKLAQIINRLSIFYNNASIFCENNGEGSAVVSHLWWTFENGNLFNEKNQIGVNATYSTKSKAVTMMKKMLEYKYLQIFDFETVKQLSTFIETEQGKMKGQDNAADDLVSALYWACYPFILKDFFSEDTSIKEQNTDSWGILSDIEDNYTWNWNF